MKFFKQRGDYDCGITSLQSVLTKFKVNLAWQVIFDLCQQVYKQDIRITGTGVGGMRNTLKYVNKTTNRKLRLRVINHCGFVKLKSLIDKGYSIILNGYNQDLTENHFMVFYGYTEKYYKVFDPGKGKHKRLTKDKLKTLWTYNGKRGVIIIYE